MVARLRFGKLLLSTGQMRLKFGENQNKTDPTMKHGGGGLMIRACLKLLIEWVMISSVSIQELKLNPNWVINRTMIQNTAAYPRFCSGLVKVKTSELRRSIKKVKQHFKRE